MPIKLFGHRFNFLHQKKTGCLVKVAPGLMSFGRCFCLPLTKLPGNKLKCRGGIFLENGEYVPLSGLVTNGQSVVDGGEGVLPVPQKSLSGRSLYLGICHYHYGHFLVETLSRLWCFDRQQLADFDHILLLPLDGSVQSFVYDLFRFLGLEQRLYVVKEPLSLEYCCIPDVAIKYPNTVHQQIEAIPALFAEGRVQQRIEQPLYISRTKLLPGHHRVIIGEDWLENILADQGIKVFHPQNYSVIEQMNVMRQHSTLIGFAGSALHTLILAGGRKRVFAYSSRPIPSVFGLLDLALGNEGIYIQAKRKSISGLAKIATGFTPQLIDPRIVLNTLKQEGVIGNFDLGSYGSTESDAREVCRYNTALLLRRILEASHTKTDSECRTEIEAFKNDYFLDEAMLNETVKGSALLRRIFCP